MSALPLPPMNMRQAVGPTDAAAFENSSGAPFFPHLPEHAYDSVLDFGCGCGRIARQLIQQTPRPRRYLGIDLNLAAIDWCEENLAPAAPGFEFRHHDVRYEAWNPGEDKPETAEFPVRTSSCSLVIAYSVFTHLVEDHAEYYLREAARALRPDGFLVSTWFLFDKALFPMMQEFQNALYINHLNPANAVILDRAWLVDAARSNGLVVVRATPPQRRGYQWEITMTPEREHLDPVELTEDRAPIGFEGTRSAPFDPVF